MFHFPLAEITFGLLEVSSIELMFAGINMVFGLTQTHFGLSIQRGFKWVLRRAKNIFMPKNINCIFLL
jgi:hypothetical protein